MRQDACFNQTNASLVNTADQNELSNKQDIKVKSKSKMGKWLFFLGTL